MSERVQFAVVGSGPGGMSAAAHCAELGLSHVLLEATPAHSNTIQRYQKGKHVMAEPGVLPLRSELEFEAGTRENILERWLEGMKSVGVNIRYNSEVVGISGQKGDFTITLKSGDTVQAEFVVMGIGMQGNPRKLGCEGEDLPFIQYTLDDPDEYQGEHIVVVGAGDAAIENAIALAKNNTVSIVNRRDEFARAKQGNLDLITNAIESEKIQCFYETNVGSVNEEGEHAGTFILKTPQGETPVPCDRIIARLGAIPPRKFVESCGIEFPTPDPTSIPELSSQYESNVPGLYVVGALGGYPLIKQAMNQGYEVVEYALGNDIEPADNPLLAEKIQHLPFKLNVEDTLTLIQQRVPIFSEVNALMFRELMMESALPCPAKGDIVFEKDGYTSTFFGIVSGSVEVQIGPEKWLTLQQGQFFGEMGLISGRRRTATVKAGADCVLVEIPRRAMKKLLNSVESVQRGLDEAFILRTLQTRFAPNSPAEALQPIAAKAELKKFAGNEILFSEGDEADSLHLIRSGSITVSKEIGGRDITLSYVPAGNYVGEMGLLGNTQRSATIKANVPTETISLDADSFNALLDQNPALRQEVSQEVASRVKANAKMASQPDSGDLITFLMKQGLGEATDVLLIDEALCVGCDNCEKACAETHEGTSRLDREAGPTFANVHVPTSCRHCEDPHCMKDCPPDAIRRAPNGEVFIESNCIGCGNCERNCPYGVIHMAYPAPPKPKLWQWLMFGAGPGPGEDKEWNAAQERSPDVQKKAVKCDMCKDQKGGPACVRACPTGAALRISPEQLVGLVNRA